MAYGSDAFGGVIAATTRKVAPGAPLAVRLSGTLGTGVPERRLGGDVSKGTGKGSVLSPPTPATPTTGTARRARPSTPATATAACWRGSRTWSAQGYLSAGYQGDFGRDIERPRNNSATVRFFYPSEDSHRFTAEYDAPDVGPFDEIGLQGFYGHYAQVTDQDRFATATTARSVERADISAHDFQFRGYARRPLGPARWEMGVDVNGRDGLRALDIIERVQPRRQPAAHDRERVDRLGAARRQRRLHQPRGGGGCRGCRWPAAGGSTTWRRRTRGGYFGDRSVNHGAGVGVRCR